MTSSILSSMKAVWLVTTTVGVLLSVAAWAADYPGYIKLENFDEINGGNIADLTAAAKYTNNLPDSVTFVDSLYYSRTPGVDNYGSRISGFLTPAETAEYVFLIAADDSTSFYLSTDSSPANKKLIAADQGWQDSRTWTGAGGASSGAGTTAAIFRRGFNPGATVMATNGFEWVGPFENRSDQFLHSARANLAGAVTNRWPTTDASGNAVINLTANQSYYFELLFKEGTGGENAGVTWKKAGDPDPANGDPEIPGTLLRVTHPTGLSFLIAPQSQSRLTGQSATFTANAVGIPGDSDYTQFTYQWLVNGQPITDGTGINPTYTIQSVALGDSGKKYSVRATTALGLTGTSVEATLTVSSDNVSPTIDKVTGNSSFDAATVKYSEPVNDAAADFNNYKLSRGVTITAAQFVVFDQNDPAAVTNRTAVRLTTSKQPDGAQLTLTVSNVKDIPGNVLTPNTATFYTPTFKTGILSHKIWLGQGTSISTLTNDPAAYGNPSIIDTRNNAEQGLNNAQNEGVPNQNYLSTLEGFFIPAVTTNYVFFFCADNDGYMYLSTDENPANKKLIAADVGWQNVRTWTGPGGDDIKRRGDLMGGGPFENRSDELLTSPRVLNGVGALNGFVPADGVDPDPWPDVDANGNAVITLTAGKRYYMELWHVEFEGGAVQATIKIAGTPDPANGTPSTLTGNLIGAIVDPSALPPTITNQPVGVDFNQGDTLTFSVGAESVLPLTYQWYRGQAAISGATNSTLTIPNAGVSAVGSYSVAVSNPNGSATSQSVLAFTAASLPQRRTFQQDGSGLVVIEAENYYDAIRAADGHVWIPQTDRAGYLGTGYMQALPDSGANQGAYPDLLTISPRLDFKVNFTKTGTNYVWLRGGDPLATGAGDSVHAGIDGDNPASARRIDGTPTFNIATGWNWVGNIQGDTRAFIVVTNAGEHTVNIWMREDGFNLDRILLTSDDAYTPTDAGPLESASVVSPPSAALTITSFTPLANAVALSWSGGTTPYLVQMKASLTDSNWFNVLTTSAQSATVAKVGDAAFFRVADHATTVVIPLTAQLNGAGEVPAVTTDGIGLGAFSLEGDTLRYLISFSGLSGNATASHIHGPAEVTGTAGVIIPFTVSPAPSGIISGSVTVTPDQKTNLLSGKTYANIHTAAHGGGEIRGQVNLAQFTAKLSGSAEVPVVSTAATGDGVFALIGNQLFYNISFTGLSGNATASHIHGPADISGSAPVIIPFTVSASTSGTISGTVTVTADQVANLVSGKTYANIHTAGHPGGEIRGQLVTLLLKATLSGSAEVPAVSATGSATGVFALTGNQLNYAISYSGLSGNPTAAHIHGPADASATAGVIIPFTVSAGTSGTITGTVAVTSDQLTYLLTGRTYANIHTAANPGGEIRGQITP